MKTDLILKFKQNLFSKVIWSSTFKHHLVECALYSTQCRQCAKVVAIRLLMSTFVTQVLYLQIFYSPQYSWFTYFFLWDSFYGTILTACIKWTWQEWIARSAINHSPKLHVYIWFRRTYIVYLLPHFSCI